MVQEWKLIREEKGGECPRQGRQVVVISSSSSRESSVCSRNRNWVGRIMRVEYRAGLVEGFGACRLAL